jgi:hypothetical protein
MRRRGAPPRVVRHGPAPVFPPVPDPTPAPRSPSARRPARLGRCGARCSSDAITKPTVACRAPKQARAGVLRSRGSRHAAGAPASVFLSSRRARLEILSRGSPTEHATAVVENQTSPFSRSRARCPRRPAQAVSIVADSTETWRPVASIVSRCSTAHLLREAPRAIARVSPSGRAATVRLCQASEIRQAPPVPAPARTPAQPSWTQTLPCRDSRPHENKGDTSTEAPCLQRPRDR